MNEGLKERLDSQGTRTRVATLAHNVAKTKLEAFDAHSRVATRADGVKRTEADTDAIVAVAHGRSGLVDAFNRAKADMDATDVETKCLIAHVSLVCAEVAAVSRISQ